MARGRNIDTLLRPLKAAPTQYYLGTGLHTLGLLGWILQQTGKADVWVSTFSTSDAFLSGFLNLRKKGDVGSAILVADMKASRKTIALYRLMQGCFEHVFLAQNHSKVVLVKNEQWKVTVISSQNQTYGDRAECTMVTVSEKAFQQVFDGLNNIITHRSIKLDGFFDRRAKADRRDGDGSDVSLGDWRPFGV